LNLSELSARERLAAEQAVLTLRALDKAADEAPQGEGLNRLEGVIHEQGFEHLRQMLSSAIGAREEAQKRGSAFAVASVVAKRSSRRATAARS